MIELVKINSGDHGFSLKAEDGGNLLHSIAFSSKREVNKIIEQLKSIKPGKTDFERLTNHDGKFLFTLKDKNGRRIGQSELYSSEAGMENGIKNVLKRLTALSRPNGL